MPKNSRYVRYTTTIYVKSRQTENVKNGEKPKTKQLDVVTVLCRLNSHVRYEKEPLKQHRNRGTRRNIEREREWCAMPNEWKKRTKHEKQTESRIYDSFDGVWLRAWTHCECGMLCDVMCRLLLCSKVDNILWIYTRLYSRKRIYRSNVMWRR